MFESSSKDTEVLSLTVYNNGFAVVRESRKLKCDNEEYIKYLDVAAEIETDSLIIHGVMIKEINYEYDLVDKFQLLDKYIDKEIYIANNDEGIKQKFILLSSYPLIVKNPQTLEIHIEPKGEIILPELPDGLATRPSLIWRVIPAKYSSIDVSYITEKIIWNALYVMNINNNKMSLNGWINVSNRSGMTFNNANLKFIAGDINKILKAENCIENYKEEFLHKKMAVSFKAFSDYYLYMINFPVTLKNKQDKEINFINIDNIILNKVYELYEYEPNARIIYYIENIEKNKLGIPLPEGKVMIYETDCDSTEFIGEEEINHTPAGQTITLNPGKAFDITGEYKILSKEKISGGSINDIEIEIRNSKKEEAEIHVHYTFNDYWKIMEYDHEYEKYDYSTIIFKIKMQPSSTKKIKFKYKTDTTLNIKLIQ